MQEFIIDSVALEIVRFLQEERSESRKGGAQKIWAISAVDERLSAKRGSLSTTPTLRLLDAIRKRFATSRLADSVLILGVDLSLDTSRWWQPHFYGLCVADSKRAVRETLKPYFHSTGTGSSALRVREVPDDEVKRAAAYVLKPNLVKRRRYLGKNGRMETAKGELKANEKVEAAEFLGKLGFRGRLLLRGLKIVKGKVVRSTSFPHHKLSNAQKGPSRGAQAGSVGLIDQKPRK